MYNSQEARSLKGELQIYITDGHSPLGWSRVCNTEHFDNDEAEVCCKQLGLSPDGRIISEMTGYEFSMKYGLEYESKAEINLGVVTGNVFCPV